MQLCNDRIEQLDTTLFNNIPTISSEGDRLSWLTVQRAIRRATESYSYLEIGSYLGGSLQQHYVDPKCIAIYSIDRRPEHPLDERGAGFDYPNDCKERMFAHLSRLDPGSLDKIRYFESDAQDIDPKLVSHRPEMCFIDGEHTNEAVVRDFTFCRKVCASNAAILFHDAPIIHDGLRQIIRSLRTDNVSFQSWKLSGSTFAIVFSGSPAAHDPAVRKLAHNGSLFLMGIQGYKTARQFLPANIGDRLYSLGKRIYGSS